MSAGNDDEWDDADWDSEEGDALVASLLGDGGRTLPCAADAWAELRAATGFDFHAWRASTGADGYKAVRLVNSLRRAALGAASAAAAAGASKEERIAEAVKAALAPSVIGAGAAMWGDDELLLPPLEGDALIMAVLADEDEQEEERAAAAAAAAAVAPPAAAPAAAAAVTDRVVALETELQSARALIARLTASAPVGGGGDGGSDDGDDDDEAAGQTSPRWAFGPSASGEQDNDTYYFNSYANSGIHADMLRDAVRTEAYRDAIVRHPHWFAGKTVADVGCGTGILSMFAARAQAAGEAAAAGAAGAAAAVTATGRVLALDASRIVEDARSIVAANGLAERVAVVRGKVEQLDLAALLAPPVKGGAVQAPPAHADGDSKRVLDVIISEWMGYALLYECMLDSVLAVRDTYLRAGGRMLPSRASIHVAGVCDAALWHAKAGFWADVYGFDLSTMSRHVFAEPYVEVLPAACLGTSTADLAHLDLLHMARSEQDIVQAPFALQLHPGVAVLHGVALWFDCGFGEETFDPARVRGVRAGSGGGGGVGVETAPPHDSDEPPPLEAAGGDAVSSSAAAAQPAAAASAAVAPDLPPAPVSFSTSPGHTPTHWQQALMLLEPPLRVAGDVPAATSLASDPHGSSAPAVVRGTLSMVRDPVNPREYRFQLELIAPTGVRHTQSFHMR